MKSVVNDTDCIVRVAESVIPEIKHQDEVRVKIASSGLCGSDLPRIFKNGAHYYPITLGHEFSGYIDAVGSGVDDLHPGDAVACVPLLPCFTCPECLKGFYSQCAKYDFIGSRRDGGFAEYIVVKRNNVFALPADMPIEDGAFIEPITVGLHAFHLAQGCENKNVIIIGAGTIGLLIFWVLLVMAIMSWVSQGRSPIEYVLIQLADPLLRPIRRLLPAMGGIDFSPMILVLLLYVINMGVAEVLQATGNMLLPGLWMAL